MNIVIVRFGPNAGTSKDRGSHQNLFYCQAFRKFYAVFVCRNIITITLIYPLDVTGKIAFLIVLWYSNNTVQ